MNKVLPNLPPNAKSVFKGVIFEVYQWEQKMYDGTIEIFEKIKRPNTVSVIATVKDKILLQTQEQPDRPQPFASLPGGRIENGEDSLTAAKREMLEETGYISNDWTLWKSQNPYNKTIWTIYTYIARNCIIKQTPKLDAGEKITTKLITFDEFIELCEDDSFSEKELKNHLLRAKFDSAKKENLRKLLFP